MVVYPTVEILILTNKRIIEETRVTKAERHGLLVDKNVLENIIKEMEESQDDVYYKAAILLTRLVQRHPFESGNRRTAFLATINFLEVNKISFNINKDKIENVLQGVRERFYSLDEIRKWIKTGDIHEFKRE